MYAVLTSSRELLAGVAGSSKSVVQEHQHAGKQGEQGTKGHHNHLQQETPKQCQKASF